MILIVMFLTLRLNVSISWVLWCSLIFATTRVSDCSSPQLRLTDPNQFHCKVNRDVHTSVNYLDISVDLCTDIDQSCDEDLKMPLTNDQKQLIKSLYKIGQKVIQLETNISFLSRCQELKLKMLNLFKWRTRMAPLGGNYRGNQEHSMCPLCNS